MKLEQALEQAATLGRGVARLSWINEAGETEQGYMEYLDRTGLEGSELSLADYLANDWLVEPERAMRVNEALLVQQWNASLAPGSSESNRAPNSARFQRFLAGVKAGSRGL